MREIEALMKEVASEDPFSDRSQMKIERVNSIRETIQDLFRIRAEKILGFAYAQEEGQPVDRDEKKRMLPGEIAMFDAITAAIRECHSTVIGGTGMMEQEIAGESRSVVPVCRRAGKGHRRSRPTLPSSGCSPIWIPSWESTGEFTNSGKKIS